MNSRWSVVVNSNCMEGNELKRAWDILTKEVREAESWLDEEKESVFQVPLACLGEGSVSDETRGKIVAARERIHAKLLSKALSLPKSNKSRAVLSWKQRDKISSSWLLALPGGDSSLSNAEFSEAAAANLCMFRTSWRTH